jgi:hypothetical protein
MNEPDFYVGYSTRAPHRLGRFIGGVAAVAVFVAAALALALSAKQDAFAPSRFEFGRYQNYTGVLISDPVPMLADGPRAYLLVAPGKHGAAEALRPLDGQRVAIRGTLAENGPDALIEIDPAAVRPLGPGEKPKRVPLGDATLTGEIVDSKCYLGVMNPGRGKVHRDCAARCLSGGIPPALLIRDDAGQSRVVLLHGPDLGRKALSRVAERVRVSGRLYRIGDRNVLDTYRLE